MIGELVDQLGLPGVIHYLDDILMHSKDFDSHLKLVDSVLGMHKREGLLIKPSKTVLFREGVEFLGNWVSKDGLCPTDKAMGKIKDWPTPKTPKELSSFVGFISFYSSYIQGFAALAAPLNALKSKKVLVWTEELNQAFLDIKSAFASQNGRSHLILDEESMSYLGLVVDIDFSKTAISGVVNQVQNGQLRFITAKSRKCRPYESRYHSSKGEMIALFYALSKFESLLKGQPF